MTGPGRVVRGLPALWLGALLAAGCAPTMLQAPQVGELRRHEGPGVPLTVYVMLELRKFEIRGGGPLHTKDALAPPRGVQLARDIIREKLAEIGLFEAVEVVDGPPPEGKPGIVLRTALDILVTTPAWGVTSFHPRAYVTATHVGRGGVRQPLFANAHYEAVGTMGDNVFAIGETVMLAWRTGGEAIATQLANDLPRRLAASAAGARLLGQVAPSSPPRPEAPQRPEAPPPAPDPRAAAVSSGSGFLLRNTNLVLTNYHVVRDKTQITLIFPSGEEYPGRVAYRDRGNDLALVEARGLTGAGRGLTVSVNSEIKVGETVHALGYPLGAGLSRQPSMVSGAVSATTGLDDDISRFRMTAPINPGNSGGPIVNQRGQVIGIAAAGLVREGIEAIRFGIKASTAALILQQAQVVASFDVVVTPSSAQPTPPEQIFSALSSQVVLIEAR